MRWGKLSTYRGELMGIATIAVVVFHFFEMVGKHIHEVRPIIQHLYGIGKFGYMGVEVFLLVSGIGCYYSLNHKFDIKSFYIKRFMKILIPYLIIGGLFYVIRDIFLLQDIKKCFLDFVGVNLVLKNERTFWYVFLILFVYLIYPILFTLFSSENRTIRNSSFLFLELFFILTTIYMYTYQKHVFDMLQLFYTRIPIFIFGAYIAKDVQENKKVNYLFLTITLVSVLFISKNFDNQMILRFKNSIEAIGLCFVCIFIMDIFHSDYVSQVFSIIGKYSYEVYLLHVALRNYLNIIGWKTYNGKVYLLIVFLVIILVPIINYISNYVYKSSLKIMSQKNI